MKLSKEDLHLMIDCLHFTIKFAYTVFGKPTDDLLALFKKLTGEDFDENGGDF